MKTVDECKGCLYNGRLMRCAARELRWAWYCFLRDMPFLNLLAKEPEPCWMREVLKDADN